MLRNVRVLCGQPLRVSLINDRLGERRVGLDHTVPIKRTIHDDAAKLTRIRPNDTPRVRVDERDLRIKHVLRTLRT